jgi:hypothetical protein
MTFGAQVGYAHKTTNIEDIYGATQIEQIASPLEI